MFSNMRYDPYPRAFQTKNWRKLYESYILDLTTLKAAVNRTATIIIDAEPWGADDTKPAELGISLLPALNETHMSVNLPKSLDAKSHVYGLETHWIRLVGRERRETNRENHQFGQRHYIENDQVEQTISAIIDQFMRKNYGHSSSSDSLEKVPLILAGFSLDFEFRILSTLYPNLLQYFTSWTDLQEIAREVASDADSRLRSPGLHETVIACGFKGGARTLASTSSQHNAATDTVRAAAVLAYFTAMLGNGEKLDIPASSRRKNHSRKYRNLPTTPGGRKLWNGMRPQPKEFYPYIARVSRIEDDIDLDTQAFFDLFTTYEPLAVGIAKGRRYGWVCISDTAALEGFVKNINGSTLRDGRVWRAVSGYDPAIVPARNWDELKENRRLALESKVDEKRSQRQAKRDAQDAEINLN